MWRALKREVNPRSLSAILAEIGIAAWNLHNAGNDAVYTLQAMLGIACKHLVERKIERKEKDKLKKDRISEYVYLSSQPPFLPLLFFFAVSHVLIFVNMLIS